jgi:hypothetical protein
MKTIKLNLAAALIAIALFSGAAFADGDMGSGGFVDSDQTPTPTKIERSLEDDGDMGSGGLAANQSYLKSVFDAVYDYLESMM